MALFGKTNRSQKKEQESFYNAEKKSKNLSTGGTKKIDKMQNNLKTL